MTDRPRYQDSKMEGQEAKEYAKEELGEFIQEVRNLPSREVVDYWSKLKAGDYKGVWQEHENGYILLGKKKDKIINPKKVIGNNPRIWVDERGELYIYFKKEGDYYLIRLEP